MFGIIRAGFRFSAILAAALVILHPTGRLGAQQLPYEGGQWAGPYELAVDDDGDPQTPPFPTDEISHALLLPPAGPGEPQSDRVLFEARITPLPPILCNGCEVDTANQLFGRTYRWTPRNPSNVTLVPIPAGYPQDGSQTFFCGGHTFLPNGHVIWAGGTDLKSQCADGNPGVNCVGGPRRPFGHDHAWRLDTSTWLPSWHAASDATNKMSFPRWYPTVTLRPDGSVQVDGHTAQPILSQDGWRDILSAPTGSFSWTSFAHNPWTAACNAATLVRLVDYPRLHMLSTGELFWSAAFTRTILMGGAVVYGATPSRFLDVEPQVWSCPDERWLAGSTTQDIRINGSSVHFVVRDELTGEPVDVVYAIGGAAVALEGNPNDCPEADGLVHASVEKIVGPSGSSSAVWQSAPSMNFSRVNHNAVILLDGSIMVVGGMSVENGECTYRFVPERYRPLEVFSGITPPGPGWQLLAEHFAPRQYHSTAVLLPDGRVVLAGGKNLPALAPEDCDGIGPDHPTCSYWDLPDHTVEVYSPYYFFDQTRPEIDAATFDPSVSHPATDAFGYDAPMSFEVNTIAPMRRVALIRNGGATHAFDSSQRFVELRIVIDQPIVGQPGRRFVRVIMPETSAQAPPGYYLLTVTDTNNMPSPAEWVRLE